MKRISPRPSKKIRSHYSAWEALTGEPFSLKDFVVTMLFTFLFSFLFFVYLFCFY